MSGLTELLRAVWPRAVGGDLDAVKSALSVLTDVDPGDRRFWAVGRVLLRLHESGLIYLVQIGGSPYVCLGDDVDVEIARRYRERRQVRPVRIVA